MCTGSVWQAPKIGRVRRRSCRPVTAKSRRTQTASTSVYDRQTAESMRLLWLAIGRDPDVQRRVMQLLEETRIEAGYEPL